jgi:hypothetical protein
MAIPILKYTSARRAANRNPLLVTQAGGWLFGIKQVNLLSLQSKERSYLLESKFEIDSFKRMR